MVLNVLPRNTVVVMVIDDYAAGELVDNEDHHGEDVGYAGDVAVDDDEDGGDRGGGHGMMALAW